MSSEKAKRDNTSIESVDRNTYAGDYETTIVEQWKACVETANSITEKRNTANSIFITQDAHHYGVRLTCIGELYYQVQQRRKRRSSYKAPVE